ncbi:MAG: hypothetical protein FJW88_07135 [Actinobacteria bacterium]|nr:hypothetical protein [Actinomycetota bacterium]
MPDLDRFEPELVLRALVGNGVAFVVIGGYAATLHGSPSLTLDADVCAARDRDNLERLVAALREVHARIRTDAFPEGVAVTLDARFLEQMKMVNLVTDGGSFDLAFEPAGFPEGYAGLAPHAVGYDIDGLVVPTAALADIIRSKEAADRPKDRAVLPILKALQDEIAYREQSSPGVMP